LPAPRGRPSRSGAICEEPKTARGKRTIAIDEDLAGRLLALRDHVKRLIAGIPGCDPAGINLDLAKLAQTVGERLQRREKDRRKVRLA
jgi:hypothetical protein